MLSINIPFSGFYDSLYSSEIDRYTENHGENCVEDETGPEEIQIKAEEFDLLISDAMDYQQACENVAKAYVHSFNRVVSEIIGIDLGLKFEEMTSPREYNFTTDRIFCEVSRATIAKLFRLSRRDGHKALTQTIRNRFTSRDGFASYYENDLASWLAKPLSDWDHNELGTLLIAVMALKGAEREDWEMSVYSETCDDGCYQEIESAIDWDEYETKVAELREEKAKDFAAEHPDYVPAPKPCDQTPDLFGDN